MLVYNPADPFLLVHSLNWRKNGTMMVLSVRHGHLSLEPFLGTDPDQVWYITPNGEMTNKSSPDRPRYLNQQDGCREVMVSTTPATSWVLDGMGEHPRKFRVVPRQCPDKALRCTLGSFVVGLEEVAVNDDSNGWYFLTMDEMLGKKTAHARPE